MSVGFQVHHTLLEKNETVLTTRKTLMEHTGHRTISQTPTTLFEYIHALQKSLPFNVHLPSHIGIGVDHVPSAWHVVAAAERSDRNAK